MHLLSKFELKIPPIYPQTTRGSWGLSTCVFASRQGCHAPQTMAKHGMAAMHACKYTCGQSPGAHANNLLIVCHSSITIWSQNALSELKVHAPAQLSAMEKNKVPKAY